MTKDEDLWSDEICALVDAAFETVSRNPSDHEEAFAYRRAIAAAIDQQEDLATALGATAAACADHLKTIVQLREQIAILRQPAQSDALKVARSALQGMVLYSEMNECWQDDNPQYVEAADEAIDFIDAALEQSK